MSEQRPGGNGPADDPSADDAARQRRRSQAERTLGHDPKTAPWMPWGTGTTDARPAPDPNEPITDEFEGLAAPEPPAAPEPAAAPEPVAEPVAAAASEPEPEPVAAAVASAPDADATAKADAPARSGVAAGARLPRGRRAIGIAVAVLVVVVLLGEWAISGKRSDQGSPAVVASQPPASSPGLVSSTSPAAKPRELAPASAEAQLGKGHVALKVTRTQLLRTRPAADGQLVARVGTKTPYGSATILPIVKAEGDWVAVVSPYRKNNRVAWTKVQPGSSYVAVDYSIAIRVHDRSIIVRRNGEVVRRMKAAVGQVTHPTPPGRYAVTDGLIFPTKVRGPYGCCALVLSARQPKLPVGWAGGDRIAIHGTSNKDSIGLAASLGCLRVGDEASRWLVRNVPSGTTVFVRS